MTIEHISTIFLYTRVYLETSVNHIFNRPSVAEDVLQTPSSLIHWLIKWMFPPHLQNIINHKPQELKYWENIHRSLYVIVTYLMSCITCHMSQIIFPPDKWWSLLVEGLLSKGPTPSSFLADLSLSLECWRVVLGVGAMKPRLFLLLLLLTLPTTLSVGKDEEQVVGKDEEQQEEDTCLSSPCGSRARCKNVKVRTLSLQKVQDQAERWGLHSVLPA